MRKKVEEHVEDFKKILVINPEVLFGEKAKLHIQKKNDVGIRINGGFSYDDNTVAVIDIARINTLAHEMRHAYQYKNKEEYGYRFGECSSSSFDYKEYYLSPKERDAVKFAMNYCWKNQLYFLAFKVWFSEVAIANISIYSGLYKIPNLFNSKNKFRLKR